MISYPRRSSTNTNTHTAPLASERPATYGSNSIGPWPLKSESFKKKFPNHRRSNSIGPWPLKHSRSEGDQRHKPMQILRDLREVNAARVSVALSAVDEESAHDDDIVGDGLGGAPDAESINEAPVSLRVYHNLLTSNATMKDSRVEVHCLVALALFTTVLSVSPPLFTFLFAPKKVESANIGTACLYQAVNAVPPDLFLGSYGFLICLALLPCAALGGIVGIAFHAVSYIKEIRQREYQIAIHGWRDTKQPRRMSTKDLWLKTSLSVMLGVLIFGGWTALWIWPVLEH